MMGMFEMIKINTYFLLFTKKVKSPSPTTNQITLPCFVSIGYPKAPPHIRPQRQHRTNIETQLHTKLLFRASLALGIPKRHQSIGAGSWEELNQEEDTCHRAIKDRLCLHVQHILRNFCVSLVSNRHNSMVFDALFSAGMLVALSTLPWYVLNEDLSTYKKITQGPRYIQLLLTIIFSLLSFPLFLSYFLLKEALFHRTILTIACLLQFRQKK